jgi:hypothetical protein
MKKGSTLKERRLIYLGKNSNSDFFLAGFFSLFAGYSCEGFHCTIFLYFVRQRTKGFILLKVLCL